MPTCLVIGASGFLGRELVARLERDFTVVGTRHQQAGPGLVPVDIRQPDALRRLLDQIRPAAVVLAAAYREPDFCEQQPEEARRLNTQPAQTLRASLPAATPLVFISTDYVFDGQRPPYGEDSPRCPVNVYGQTKCEAEDALAGRPLASVLRVGVLVGSTPSGQNAGFIQQMARAARDPRPQVLDDVLVRCPVWTRDVAAAVAFLLARRAEGVFHAGGPRGGTRYAWNVELAHLLGLPADHLQPSRQVIPRAARRPPNSRLASDRILAAGFPGFTDFADVVPRVLADPGAS